MFMKETLKISDNCLKIIKFFEQLHDGNLKKIGLQPKMCPSGIWTVGFGHALFDHKGKPFKGVQDYDRMCEYYPEYLDITETVAEMILREDIEERELYVNNKLSRPLVRQCEFDALVSHTFNTGGSNILFKSFNNHNEDSIIKYNFCKRYITSNGIEMLGLKRRRMSEWILFSKGELILDGGKLDAEIQMYK